MKTTLTILLFLFLVGLPLYLFYWCIFRPVFLQHCRRRLVELRGELDDLPQVETQDDKLAVLFVAKMLAASINAVLTVDLADFLFRRSERTAKTRADVDYYMKLVWAAGPELRRISITSLLWCIQAAIANSPGLVVCFSPLVVFFLYGLALRRFKRWCLALIGQAIGNLYPEGDAQPDSSPAFARRAEAACRS